MTIVVVVNLGYLNVTDVDVGTNDATVYCTSAFACPSTCYCQVEVNGTTLSEIFSSNEATVAITDLASNTSYSYTASLVDGSGLPFDGACIVRIDSFTTLLGDDTTNISSSTASTSVATIPTVAPTSTGKKCHYS